MVFTFVLCPHTTTPLDLLPWKMKKNRVYQSHNVTWCLCCLFVVHLAFPSCFFLLFVGSPVHNSLIAYFLPVWVVQPLTPHSHSIIPPLHTRTSTSFTTLLIRFCVLLHLFCSFDPRAVAERRFTLPRRFFFLPGTLPFSNHSHRTHSHPRHTPPITHHHNDFSPYHVFDTA